MAKRLWLVLALGLALIGARPALADVWDSATANDNAAGTTENDLVHGGDQIHDLADLPGPAVDQDWYTVGEASRSSYEVVVDGTTGDLGGVTIERFDSTGTTLLGTGSDIGVGYSQHLAWENTGATSVNNAVRVQDTTCAGNPTTCDTGDQYRVRFYDTTCAIARFNNTGSQRTTLILQNTTSSPVTFHAYLWEGVTGNLAATITNAIPANGVFVQSTFAVAPTSGSITVTNNSGYGAVAGKGVAVEPATGFTFDTALSCRPH